MKNGKRPSRNEMKIFVANGLNPLNWLVVKKNHQEMLVVHRETGRTKTVLL